MWLDLRGRKALKALQEQQTTLETAQKLVKSDFAILETNWELMLDKINAAIARLNARTKAAERASAPENDDHPPVDTKVSPPTAAIGTHARMQEMRNRRGVLSR